jgi:hypothetical protein
MGLGYLGAALAGALITVLVYQFLVLPRGQAQSAPPAAKAVAADPAPAPAPPATAAPPATTELKQRIASKEQEIARLQKELGELRTQNAESQARVEEMEGKPRAWPADLPQGYKPDVMEARINALLEKSGLGELVDFDCDEFPCVAVIEAKQPGDDWNKKLQGAMSELAKTPDLGGRVSMSMSGSKHQDGDKTTMMNAVVLVPADMFDADLQKRTNNRAQTKLQKPRK